MGAFDFGHLIFLGLWTLIPLAFAALVLFALYWIVRRAVAAGIRDSRGLERRESDIDEDDDDEDY